MQFNNRTKYLVLAKTAFFSFIADKDKNIQRKRWPTYTVVNSADSSACAIASWQSKDEFTL